MKIIVSLKQVTEDVINPFDEVALEAAIRSCEIPGFFAADVTRQVIVITVGPMDWENSLRTALAMGAGRAIRIEAPADLEPLLVAQCLSAFTRKEGADLILTGRQSIDGDHNQTGQMTAALLGWGQATCVSELKIQKTASNDHEAIVQREVEGGLERWAVPLPAVMTVDLRLNAIHETGGVRYASLPNIMRARRKPLERISPALLGVSLAPKSHCLVLRQPAVRPPGKRLKTVEALISELQAAGLI